MTRVHIVGAIAGLCAVLGGCGDKQTSTSAPKSQAALGSQSPVSATAAGSIPSNSGMPMTPARGEAAKTVEGVGVVRAADPAVGALAIDHEPIPSMGWPAMSMTFKADPPTILEGVKAGEKVKFSLRTEGQDYVVTSIKKQ